MNPRLNRLFAADGRGFDVAVDHGFFGEGSFLAGIEDMARTVATLVEAGPDAIQLSPSQASLLQSVPGPAKPALVLRTDVANLYRGAPRWTATGKLRTRTTARRPGERQAWPSGTTC
jgi:fructose-bisphosphate aldolase, class I